MTDIPHTLLLVGVMAGCTAFLRFLPFALFSKGTPKIILYLGDVLPYAMIAMLVIYCLKGIDLLTGSHGFAEIISVVLVVALHKWKHSTILSILAGTVCYMCLIRVLA